MITDKTIKWFEREQKEYGTKVALQNFLWTIFSDALMDWCGVTRVRTSYKKEPKHDTNKLRPATRKEQADTRKHT